MIHQKYMKNGRCKGPLDFPMLSDAAAQLEVKLKQAEKEGLGYKRNFVTRLPLELNEGERADISVITANNVDRDGEVVLASGADFKHFIDNPVVTLGHDYSQPPIGRALWVKPEPTKATATSIKAKTEYAPEGLYPTADIVWGLVKAGFLKGKSIGFLAELATPPTQKEIDMSLGEWSKASRVIRKWTMFEYSVATVPANPAALTEAVAKGSLSLPEWLAKALGLSEEEQPILTDLWGWDDEELPAPKHSKSYEEIAAELRKGLL